MFFADKIIYKVLLLFTMMIPGIIIKKCSLAPEGFGKGLSNLVLYIAQPALVFLAYLKDYDSEILINSVYVFLLSIVAHGIFTAAAIPAFRKAPDNARRMLSFATVFSNAAFMGIPLISAVLEKDFPGATLYASIYNITFNLFLWTLGVFFCTEGRDLDNNSVPDHVDEIKNKMSFKKALLHPITIAAVLGLITFCFSLHIYVPTLLKETIGLPAELVDSLSLLVTESLGLLKGLVEPLSMLVIGLRLADMEFKGCFKDKHLYVFLGLRHIALPLLMVGIIKLLGLIGLAIHPAVSAVVVIMAAAPAATSATMFAEMYSCDSVYVSRAVTISTLLSVITMPLITLLL